VHCIISSLVYGAFAESEAGQKGCGAEDSPWQRADLAAGNKSSVAVADDAECYLPIFWRFSTAKNLV